MTPIESDIEQYVLWLGVHNYAKTTTSDRRRYLGYFTTFLEAKGINEVDLVTFEILKAYQETLFAHRKVNGEPLTFGTQAQRLIPVQQFFCWLRRSGRITANPASDLSLPRPDRRLPEATLSTTEMATFLSAPDVKRPLGLRDRAVLEVFYSCGLRRSELIELRMRDVDFDRGTVFVRSGKGAKDRYVPIGERALFWLRLYIELIRPELCKESGTDYLFVTREATPLCADWLSRRVRRYLAKAEIRKKGSCHLLRHSVATLMLEGGADIRYVAEMLGHARLETTQRYTRVIIDSLRAVHAATHPGAGLSTAMATELCSVLPGRPGLNALVG